MQNKSRIILDTNLWISFLIKKDFSKLDTLLFSRQAILVFSEELLLEFTTVIQRPRLKKYFSQSDIEAVFQIIEEYADFIEVKTAAELCRDTKDNFLLSLAIDGRADYLITGDNDLLDLKKAGNTQIITITDFLKLE